jgi:hypothetical protein
VDLTEAGWSATGDPTTQQGPSTISESPPEPACQISRGARPRA